MTSGGDAAPFDDLGPGERELVARHGAGGGERFSDAVDARIFWLASRRLELQAATNAGWDQLYRDPRDGRYWELTFPQGSLHGGGPRRLALLAPADAAAKYGAPPSP